MATYYWVGGSGTWDATSTANWSLTSGGAGGAGAPTTADDVVFNAASGSSIDTVLVVSGAVARSFLYSGAASVDFSGVGQSIELYGGFTLAAAPPSGEFNVTDLVFRLVVGGGGSSIAAAAPLKNITVINWSYPTTQTTLTLAADITCAAFYSVSASLSLNPYRLTCESFRLEGGGAGFTCSAGPGVVNIYPTSGVSTAFYCAWSGSADSLTSLDVNIINAAGPVGAYSASTSFARTTFDLAVTNSTVSYAELQGGLDNLTLNSGAVFRLDNDLELYGNLTINPDATITSSSNIWSVEVRKKTSSPNVTRYIQTYVGSTWETVGLFNYVPASTDSINIIADIGTFAEPAWGFQPGYSTVGNTAIFTRHLYLATGNVFSSTNITVVSGPIGAASGTTVSGAYTINARNSYFSLAAGVALSTVNVYGNSSSTGSIIANNLSVIAEPGAGTTTFGARPGYTISVLSEFVVQGLSEVDNVVLESTPNFGNPPGTFFLTKPSGTVDATFATITDCHASGGATFNSYRAEGCVDGGGNSGWRFDVPTGGLFLFL